MLKKITLILFMVLWGLGSSFGQITLQIADVESCTSPVEVPIIIQESITLISLQFTVQWDGSGLAYTGHTAPIFPSGNAFGGPTGDTLSFSWFDFNGFTLNAGDTIFSLQYNLTGTPGNSYDVQFYAGGDPSFPATEAAEPGFMSVTVNEIDGSVTYGNNSPIFSNCPNDVTVSNDAGVCEAAVSWTEPTVADCDNNDNPPTSTANSGDVFPVGTTTVTYSVSDADGNMGTCSFAVTVQDTEAPTITCNVTDITVTVPAGTTSTNVNDADLIPSTSDNCPAEALTYVRTGATADSGSGDANNLSYNVGTTTVTYTVTDASMNTMTCAVNVHVNQTAANAITLQIVSDTIGCNDGTARTSVVLLDNVDLVSLQFSINWDGSALTYTGNTPPIFPSGSAFGQTGDTLSFSWFDFSGFSGTAGDTLFSLLFNVSGTLGNCYPVEFYSGTNPLIVPLEAAGPGFVSIPVNTISGEVCIIDQVPPVITCPADVTIECDASTDPSNTGMATATDDCPGSPTITFADVNDLTGCSGTGTITRTWTAEDTEGNTSTCDQIITITDTTDPTFDSTPAPLTDINCGDAFPTPEILMASDNCGIATVVPTQTFTEDICNGYLVTYTWTATDACMNTSQVTATFNVNADNQGPTFDSSPAPLADINCGDAFPTPETLTASDNCGMATVVPTQTFTEDICNGYLVTYTWTATDDCMNTSQVTATFNVNADTQGPTFDSSPTPLADINCGDAFPTPETLTASDNCGMATVVPTQTFTEDICNGYLVTYTWTATDDCMNTSQVTATFNVAADVDGPTFSTPGPITIECGQDPLDTGITGDLSNVMDNCSTFTIGFTDDNTSLTGCSGTGVITRTWTVTDACNNVTTDAQVITIEDTTPPSFSAPGPVTINCDDDPNDLNITGDASNLMDNCTPAANLMATFTDVPNLSGCGGTGTIQRAWVLTDECGLSAAAQVQVITIVDNTPPSPVCKDTMLVLNAMGMASLTGTELNGGSTDNCSTTLTYSLSLSDFDCSHVGANTVTLTVLDECGNPATCTSTVTVVDNVIPMVTCPNDTVVTALAGMNTAVVNDLAANASDGCGIASISYGTTGALTLTGSGDISGTAFPLGTTVVTYTVFDNSNNSITCSFSVTVNGDLAIDCPNDTMVNNQVGLCTAVVNDISLAILSGLPNVDTTYYTITGATTGDGPNDASGTTFNLGASTVTYIVKDMNGDSVVCSFIVTVNDVENPTISCPGDTVITALPGMTSIVINDLDPTASDLCQLDSVGYSLAGVSTGSDTGSVSGLTFLEGITIVTYTAFDAAGNSATCNFMVTVNPGISIQCPNDTMVNNDAGLCTAVVNDIGVTVLTGASEVDTTYYTITGATTTDGPNDASGTTFNLGISTVTYTLEDAVGNMVTCSFTVTVADGENPTLTCPSDTTVTASSGMTSAVVNNIDPLAQDNCLLDSVGYTLSGATVGSDTGSVSGLIFLEGMTTVTYTAFDAAGNSVSCTFVVTVNPGGVLDLIDCPGDTMLVNQAGLCSAVVNDIAPIILDAGAIDTIYYNLSSGSDGPNDASGTTFPVGMTTVTYTAVDTVGNMDVCSFVVTVNDTEIPTLTCPSDTILTTSGTACLIVNDLSPTTGDNCGVTDTTYTLSGAMTSSGTGDVSGTCFVVGSTIVTYVVNDAAGNNFTCSFTVTINSSPSALISCPGDTTLSNDVGICGAVVNNIAATILVDPTSITSLTYTLSGATTGTGTDASGTEFQVGTTTVTYSAEDSFGTMDMCSFTVTVTDDEAPSMVCVSLDVFPNDPGMCSKLVSNNLAPNVNDNCGIASITYEFSGVTTGSGMNDATGSTFLIGSTIITYTATDNAGNSSTCTVLVVVNDDDFPTGIECPATVIVSPDAGLMTAVVNNIGLVNVGSDNCGIDSIAYTLSNATTGTGINDASGEIFNLGSTTVTYEVFDAFGNSVSCFFNVIVTDGTGLVECPGDPLPINNDIGLCSASVQNLAPILIIDPTLIDTLYYELSGATTGSGPNDASGIGFNVGVTTVKYVAVSGMIRDSCTFDVTIVDAQLPQWSNCPGDILMAADSADCMASPTWAIPFASDNCGVVMINPPSTSPGDPLSVGIHTITYAALDAAGNVGECSFTVTVFDATAPALTCPADLTVSTDAGLCSAVVNWTLPTATDACGLDALTSSHQPMDVFPVGNTVVTYTASDAANNISTCTFTVTVEDNELPVIIDCPTTNITLTPTSNCEAIATWPAVTATDNCSVLPLVNTHESGDTFPVGQTTVKIIALDINGNTSECEFIVNVPDNNDPVISDCPRDTILNVIPGTCSAIYVWTDPTATDDCSMVTPTGDHSSGDSFAADSTTIVTYTATDAAGNTATCSFSVTVVDNEIPTLTCPADVVIRVDGQIISDPTGIVQSAITANGCTGVDVTFDAPVGTDNCNGTIPGTQTAGPNSGSTFSVGTNMLTFTATDEAGNTATCNFNITIQALEAVTVSAMPSNTICSGSPVQLMPSVIPGATYSWSGPAGYSSTDTSPTIIIDETNVGEYTVICTTANGCSTQGSITIGLNAAPLVSVTSNSPICDGNLELNGIQDAGSAPIVSWSWTAPCGFISMDQNVSITNLSDDCSGIFTLVARTAEGCEITVTTLVEVIDIALPVIENDCDSSLCLGESCFLLGTDYVPTPNQYIWTVDDGSGGLPVETNSNGIEVTPIAAGAYTYFYSVMIDGCVSETDSLTITVSGAPDAEDDTYMVSYETSLEDFDILANDSYNATLQPVIEIKAPPTNGTLTANLDGTFTYTPANGYIGTDRFTYRLCHGCNGDLCDEAMVFLEVVYDGPCIVPTLITPNGDEANDLLTILCLDSGLFPNNSLVIFNQWGDKVFEAAPYQNDWDGTLRGEEGRHLPDGTYFYQFTRDADSQPVKGYITIFR